MEIKKALLSVRVMVLLAFILFSIFAINPRPFNEGASIRMVELNSSASLAGIVNPKPTAPPLSRELITAIDNVPIKSELDYYTFVSKLEPDQVVQVKTNKALYKLTAKTKENKTDLGMTVVDAPTSNIRKGLDLQGGSRIVLQPQEELSDEDMETVIMGMGERLNVFGLTDVTIKPVSDLQGKRFIMVEVAGGNDQEIKDLIAKQGKFEAKVGNDSVFRGGNDITYVCRSADCSGLSPYRAPTQASDGTWASTFQFAITLSKEAAQRMSESTKKLTVQGEYLSEPISLFLDDQLVDQLQISSSLRGQVATDIAISGPGLGTTMADSQLTALQNMKKLQTIIITGSLPVKLNIVKTDTISPVLGDQFTSDAIKMMFFAILAVAIVIFVRYRSPQIVIPIFITSVSEVLIIMGVAALIGWNIDIAAIAGILVAVGTGVDDQIVIVDESRAHRNVETSWLKKMKNAFFIIFAAYFCGVVSMIPLMFAGAGLLKGFALTSIIGITAGVFVTRPAFAAVAEQILKEE